jgi:hypothetical protein
VSQAGGLLLIMLVTSVVSVVGILVVGRARKQRATEGEGLASRAVTQRFLAENWGMVEKTARDSGMSEDEISHVRAKVLGLGDEPTG